MSARTARHVEQVGLQGAGVSVLGFPEHSLLDEPVRPRILGLPSRVDVELTLTLRGHRGVDWRSTAVFRTDATGVIDLGRDVTVGGTYAGVDASGLWWSLRPVDGTELAADDHAAGPLR